MPFLGIFSWAQYSLPAGIPSGALAGDTQPNDPAAPGYNSGSHSWIGETFTFNGGGPTQIEINDDDATFEDGYVETGAAQTLTSGITIDGTFYAAGSVVENEFSLIDASGQEIYVVRINGQNVGFTYAVGEQPATGESFTATSGLDGDPADNAGGAGSSTEPYGDVICYAAGTLIGTPCGSVAVENLRRGEKVSVPGMAAQPVLWLGCTEIDLTRAPANTLPILIPAGRLGAGLPRRDLVVSQQHRILFSTKAGEVFVPAKALLGLRGVRVMAGRRSITYCHLLLPQHSVIHAEGASSESFYPGPTALAMMQPHTRDEVLAALERAIRPREDYGPLARRVLTVAEGKALAARLRDEIALDDGAGPQSEEAAGEPRQIHPPPRMRLPSLS